MREISESKRNGSPFVTVLTAFYNDEKYISKAINSVLKQTYPHFEYLLINDGSSDKSRDIAAGFDDDRIVLLDNQSNIGLTMSLNNGLAQARGDLIARFDSNDICKPQRLAKQVEYLLKYPSVVAVGSQVRGIDVCGRGRSLDCAQRPLTSRGILYYSVYNSPLNHTSAMFRKKEVLAKCVGYDENCFVGQDYDLWSRLCDHYALANLPDRLVDVRIDSSSVSGRFSKFNGRKRIVLMQNVVRRNLQRFGVDRLLADQWSSAIASLMLNDLDTVNTLGMGFYLHMFSAVSRICRSVDDILDNECRIVERLILSRLFRASCVKKMHGRLAVLSRLCWLAPDVAFRIFVKELMRGCFATRGSA